MVKTPSIMIPESEKTGDLKQDLLNRAKSIESLKIQGRLKISNRTSKFPSFNCAIWFFSKKGKLLLRIRGSGPFGVTVFDLLADRREVWIYLPQQGKILKGNTFFTDYGNISVDKAIRLMEMCLNPWSPARYCSPMRLLKNGSNGIASLVCCLFGQDITLSYRLPGLTPIIFDSGLTSITFSTSQELEADAYPREISFLLKNDGIKGTLSIREIKFNNLSPNSPIFDRALFSH